MKISPIGILECIRHFIVVRWIKLSKEGIVKRIHPKIRENKKIHALIIFDLAVSKSIIAEIDRTRILETNNIISILTPFRFLF